MPADKQSAAGLSDAHAQVALTTLADRFQQNADGLAPVPSDEAGADASPRRPS